MAKNTIFKSVEKETSKTKLTVTGEIPNWIKGQFLRNGPAKFEDGNIKMKHWFDGYSLLHSFIINKGTVSYQNKFLESDSLEMDTKNNKIVSSQWGTVADPEASIFNKFSSSFKAFDADNTNVNILKIKNRYFAISDYSTMVEFNNETLETKGRMVFNDQEGDFLQNSSAHPSIDPYTGEIFNVLMKYAPKGNIRFYRIKKGETKRTLLAKFKIPKPTYFHSLALTEDYVIFIEQPLQINAYTLAFSRVLNRPIESHFEWNKNRNVFYHLYNRKTGKLTKMEGKPYYFFHTANCFQTDKNTLHIDLCRYENFDINKKFYLDSLAKEGLEEAELSLPYRITLNLQKNTVSEQKLGDTPMELPQFNKNKSLKDYNFLYGLGIHPSQQTFLNQIVKTNVKTGKSIIWFKEDHFASEPLFIPTPNAKAEDDGVLISMVLDAKENKTKLFVFNAVNLSVLAVADTPACIPPGLHGNFYKFKN